jgi:2-keto-4-pentenoate hydratase
MDPLEPLTWLANELSRTGIGLRAGEVVSTGTCTGMPKARAGAEHVADYGPFGEVRVRFAWTTLRSPSLTHHGPGLYFNA